MSPAPKRLRVLRQLCELWRRSRQRPAPLKPGNSERTDLGGLWGPRVAGFLEQRLSVGLCWVRFARFLTPECVVWKQAVHGFLAGFSPFQGTDAVKVYEG